MNLLGVDAACIGNHEFDHGWESMLDKLEMALQGKIYEKENDPEKIKPFIISAVEQIVDDDLKKILIEIIQKT